MMPWFSPSTSPVGRRAFHALAVAMLGAACSGGPQPIAYGVAECDYCRMRIGDPRFGAEIISAAGKVLQFDSIECAAGYYAGLTDSRDVRGVWVSDFRHPGTLIPVAEARFGRLEGRLSPMGGGLFAVAANEPPNAGTTPAATLAWTDVVALARREVPASGAIAPHADTAVAGATRVDSR
jgi:copper chaperone NosL